MAAGRPTAAVGTGADRGRSAVRRSACAGCARPPYYTIARWRTVRADSTVYHSQSAPPPRLSVRTRRRMSGRARVTSMRRRIGARPAAARQITGFAYARGGRRCAAPTSSNAHATAPVGALAARSVGPGDFCMNTRPLVALRAVLAVLLIGALPVSGFGQAAPAAAQPARAAAAPGAARSRAARARAARSRAAGTGAAGTQAPPAAPASPAPADHAAANGGAAGRPASVDAAAADSAAAAGARPCRTAPGRESAPPPSQAAPIREQLGGGPARKMSVDEAVQLALEQNLDVQVERINPQLQDLHDPAGRRRLGAQPQRPAQYDSTTTPPDSLFSGADGSLTSKRAVRHRRHRPAAALRHQLLDRLGRLAPDDATTSSRASTRGSARR